MCISDRFNKAGRRLLCLCRIYKCNESNGMVLNANCNLIVIFSCFSSCNDGIGKYLGYELVCEIMYIYWIYVCLGQYMWYGLHVIVKVQYLPIDKVN